VASESFAAGTVLGNYRIDRLVGSGEMGQVYAATHQLLQKRVALKVLARELVGEPVLVQRFLREGRAAARVRHDHIIEVFDVGVAGDVPYLAMELLEGEPLAQRFSRGPMGTEDLVALMLPVLAAVATAHEAGIVHRDLKPDNVFLRRDARGQLEPIVLDFGLSKIVEEAQLNLTDTNAMMGTPFYMSPEQVRGAKNVTGATDQYALGVMMYEGAVGRRPFEGSTLLEMFRKVTSGAYEAPRAANPAVPEGMEQVIARAMSFEADARYPDLWAVGRDLLPLASARDQETWRAVFSRQKAGAFRMTDDPKSKSGGRRRSRLRVLAIAGGVLAASVTGGLLAAMRAQRARAPAHESGAREARPAGPHDSK
jgi:serine/threonine protein kinase